MSAHPILILQMQRMGDLVLSFPLFALLRRQYPNRPLWVVGEEQFFVPLMPLSPPATYFPYSHKAALQKTSFSLVINLSHRPEAAQLAGSVRCEELIGPYSRNGVHHIRGQWQLYRASIAHNNRYNRYHWSDLNALDCIPFPTLEKTNWPPVSPGTPSKPWRVGLFLGASEANKRPDAAFWAGLARHLLQQGLHPVLLGGKAEETLGREVSKALGTHHLNLCGRFDIGQLYVFIRQLDALVTPDTGPMHIATLAGTRVINLSMGNVSPWETGPMSPGHFVIRANVPCLDCWQCTREQAFCKQAFKPGHVGRCIEALLTSPAHPAIPDSVEGLHILRSIRWRKDSGEPGDRRGCGVGMGYTRDMGYREHKGLHDLEPLFFPGAHTFLAHEKTRAHEAVARFWKSWFGLMLRPMHGETSGSVSQMVLSETNNQVENKVENGVDSQASSRASSRASNRANNEANNSSTGVGAHQASGFGTEEDSRPAWESLCASHPALAETLSTEGRRLLLALSRAIKTGNNPFMEDTDFWKGFAEPLLPLTGFLQLLVQNAPTVKEGFNASLELCEQLLTLDHP